MDVESFYDIECFKDKDIPYQKEYSCEEAISDYIQLLNKYDIKGTFFTLCSSLPLVKPYLKDAIIKGHEVALHGYDHKSPLLMNEKEFEENIIKARCILEQELNINIIGYRAPCFGILDSYIEILKRNGFRYDSSSLNFHLAINSGKVNLENYERMNHLCYRKDGFYEITPNRVRAYSGHLPVSGGGYIRLVPWFVIRYYVWKCIRKTDCYMFYVHPYEVSKKKAPKIKELKFVEKLFIRIGRKSYLKKIEKIIKYLKKKGFEFKSLNEYTKEMAA
jgi:peptidoglycan/xylan/chitin deacetylase (PgdA/CDA1 family)